MNEGGGEENITDYNQNYMMLNKKMIGLYQNVNYGFCFLKIIF